MEQVGVLRGPSTFVAPASWVACPYAAGMIERPPAGTVPDVPGSYQFKDADGRVLSTQVAGGFVGPHIGLYASSNGQPSESAADYDYFEYAAQF